jgi:hypothetical protein
LTENPFAIFEGSLMLIRLTACTLALAFACVAIAQDVDSGPPKGKKVPELKVYAVAGPIQGETVDYAAKPDGKPTAYLLIPVDRFSRPIHAFARELDKAVKKQFDDGLVVVVWLTDDTQKTKDLLGKISQYYDSAALTYFDGKAGPKEWFINDQADVTVILANKGEVVGRLGYNSINDTVARDVMKALTTAVKQK